MTDKQYLTLLQTMVEIGETLGARIDRHDARFDTIDQRLDSIEARLDTMDTRFNTVDRNFTEIYEILADFTQTSNDPTNETKAVQKKHDKRLSTLEKRLIRKLS